jgi:peptidoglycan/LPS O-acetylase OafA/YrhL
MPRERYTSEELKARLVFTVGVGLTFSFVLALAVILYGLLFVTQPITTQAPNDRAAWELLTPMILFLTGALSGVLASNGLKNKEKEK